MANYIRKNSGASLFNVNISLGDGYYKQNGEASVYIVTYIKGKKVKFNTGISVHPADWNHTAGRVKNSIEKAKDYNLVIASCISRINDIMIRYRLQHIPLTPELLRKEYKNPTNYTDFFSFMSAAIEERSGELTDTSIEQHYAVMHKLKEFKPVLYFSEIDQDLLKKFNRFLINTKKNSQNTRHNAFKTLKAYLNIAIDKKIIRTNPLMRLPVSRTQTDPVWLTEEELRDLVNLYERKYLPGTYQKVLRHFLFSCFTGLRISDVQSLKMEDIVSNTIVLVPYKNKNRNTKTVKIPMCRYAKKIIQDESPHRIQGPVFNMLSEARTRLYLKEAVKVAKIDKNITFHSGRHTFATMFLRKTKNIIALQRLLGHSRITETMIYTHILTEEIESEINNAFEGF